jgi:hypothetical protein
MNPAALKRARDRGLPVEAIAILDQARVEPYDSWRHKGTLRYLLLRVDGKPGAIPARTALTLVVRDARVPGLNAIADRLSKIAGVSGVHVNEQPARHWIDRLAKRGFALAPADDAFRAAIAALDLPLWYGQNVHLFERD